MEALCENLELTDVGLTLTGTVDRVRKSGGALGLADIKTGKAAVEVKGNVKTGGYAAQIGVYEILASPSRRPRKS